MSSTERGLAPGVYRRTTVAMSVPQAPRVPSTAELASAREMVKQVLAPTPTLVASQLSRRWKRTIYVKHENVSMVRSFKVRGAVTAIAALAAERSVNGATTASTGNHGQGLAFAGRHFDVPVTVVIPEDAEPAKVTALNELGASLVVWGRNLTEAQIRARELAEETGARFIEDGEHLGLMAGAASLIAEMLDQVPGLETIVVPVGGGNLIAGTLLATRELAPALNVIGVQSSAAPAATESWLAGDVLAVPSATFAGGLATEYPGLASLRVMTALLEMMVLVSDHDLWRAISTVFDATGAAVEGAGAAGVAAMDRFGGQIEGEKVGVVLTGGWISREDLVKALGRSDT